MPHPGSFSGSSNVTQFFSVVIKVLVRAVGSPPQPFAVMRYKGSAETVLSTNPSGQAIPFSIVEQDHALPSHCKNCPVEQLGRELPPPPVVAVIDLHAHAGFPVHVKTCPSSQGLGGWISPEVCPNIEGGIFPDRK